MTKKDDTELLLAPSAGVIWKAMIQGKLLDQTPIPVYSREKGWHTSCCDVTGERERD